MKKILLILLVAFTTILNAQNITGTLAARNIWRGLDQGQSPTLQFDFNLDVSNFNVGTYNTLTLNGRNEGFGNTTEFYVSYKIDSFTLTLDDFYFHGNNNYFEWNEHYPELRLKVENGDFEIMAGYDIKSIAVYVEAMYVYNDFSFILGFLTNESDLNFMNEGGITNIGVNYSRDLGKQWNLDFLVQVNPNYKNIQESLFLTRKPINFNFSLTKQF